jgi:hypothetical protein
MSTSTVSISSVFAEAAAGAAAVVVVVVAVVVVFDVVCWDSYCPHMTKASMALYRTSNSNFGIIWTTCRE